MEIHIKNIMRHCFKLALVFLSLAVLFAIISIVLRTGLQYTSYLRLFNTLAMAITASALISFSLSVIGIFREKIRRYKYFLLLAFNLLFFIWVLWD